ncbi:lipoprotein-associated protein [Mycoplasma testudineum]|uniref:Lipoprotein-associated protein n=1 Tax=Mycoplasma testudineum TaxID=244584 RepID=A0A4R6IFJ9_9MOLU|nr:lipoprotein 17-related variable surface protein [Mycoplasma testudineum]TDO20556.1 lipoprotein-associated protein [Mycoplasma testudineum]
MESKIATLTRNEVNSYFPAIQLGTLPDKIIESDDVNFVDKYLVKLHEGENKKLDLNILTSISLDKFNYGIDGRILRSEESETKTITVTGFAIPDEKQSKKDVEALKSELQSWKNLVSHTKQRQIASQVNYQNFYDLLRDIRKNIANNGAIITLGKPTPNDATGSIEFKNVTISKNNQVSSPITLVISGFRKVDLVAKSWFDKWTKRTNWKVQQYQSQNKLAFTRSTLTSVWNKQNNIVDKFNAVLENNLVLSDTPVTLDGYNVFFNLQRIETDADATTMDVEFYLSKTIGNVVTYFNHDGTMVTEFDAINRAKATLTGIVSDAAQIQAQIDSVMSEDEGAGIYDNFSNVEDFENYFNNSPDAIMRRIDPIISRGLWGKLIYNQTGYYAIAKFTNIRLLNKNNPEDQVKIRKFMAIDAVKEKLLWKYNALRLRIFSISVELNGTTGEILVGGLHRNGGGGWYLSTPRNQQIANGKLYEEFVE